VKTVSNFVGAKELWDFDASTRSVILRNVVKEDDARIINTSGQ
jgi:hypothetical protein